MDIHNNILKHLEVYHWPFSKKRMGKNHDGGYIICEIPDHIYDLFLSGGIARDISFEEDFLNLYKDTPSYAFDPNISKLPERIGNKPVIFSKNIKFIKKKISDKETEEETNLASFFLEYKNIFLKLDIESGEYRFEKSLIFEKMQKISQIVIEIHQTKLNVLENFLQNINQTHTLFHVHANNCSQSKYNLNNIIIPTVLELTFVNKRLITFNLEKNKFSFPSPLDQPNNKHKPEIILNYWPFVTN